MSTRLSNNEIEKELKGREKKVIMPKKNKNADKNNKKP